MSMQFYIDGPNVFKTDGVSTFAVGTIEKLETVRLNYETVCDISYSFDLEQGEYVEEIRTTRTELDPNAISPVDAKIAELNKACNEAILSGFTSDALGTDNSYDFDYDAQINLGGMLNAITAGMISGSFPWKASGIPQLHTINQFKAVFAAGLTHKNSNIGKYWTLKELAITATTPEEIEVIIW
ncbi:hypothetical protein PAECIP111891_02197 [Paenibacillus allorhizoplanae]|uniref:DUF4376 domain-containing protein n=1 Tax=Paenibacillus allorhizoplanae TaxID=2905648 RepID=A0ABN8GE24_9BACL|nr:hypothetical protein [Paenibacillus allorhizoplanae]CAH1203003.1 hypothetical protein PAECIP111891_02197 [Paenibacillus allorhizoplanae]